MVWSCEEEGGELCWNKTVEHGTPGRRGRGHPKQRWKDTISTDMRVVGAREEDVEDRDTWKALVSAAATPY